MKPGYEPVLDAYCTLIDGKYADRDQICIFVKGECVVDIWRGLEPDNVCTMFSNSKSVAAILLSLLHDKGLFQYEDEVNKYWPEFNKPGTTIADIMRHEGGFPKLCRPIPFDDALPAGIKANKVGKVIEETKQFYPEG